MTRDGSGGGAYPPREGASADRILEHVRALEGERHPEASPGALEAALDYATRGLAGHGLRVRREPFEHRGRTHQNVVGEIPGSDPTAPRVLVGAHVDTVRGTPGADDNASGVAGLLECARLLARAPARRSTVELVAFNLEERQGLTYRVGSRRWAARARREGVEYAGAFVLEMIGYRTDAPGSQRVPLPIRWKDVPRTGRFLAVIGDGKSAGLVRDFRRAAARAAPDLEVVTLRSPLRGWLVWPTRRSDNASFWSEGYPALLLTDTANLRNPHYHRATDRAGTLDPAFAARVVDAVVAAVDALAV